MKENLTDAMNGLRSLVGFYFTTLGLFALALIAGLFKIIRETQPTDIGDVVTTVMSARESIEVLGLVIYREYFSLLYGLLFLAFIAVLSMRLRNLKMVYDHMVQKAPAEAADQMRLFPWVASPFHTRRAGLIVFWAGLGIGLAILLWVIVFHICLPAGNISYPEDWYRDIGWFDLLLLFIALPMLWRIYSDIRSVRQCLFP